MRGFVGTSFATRPKATVLTNMLRREASLLAKRLQNQPTINNLAVPDWHNRYRLIALMLWARFASLDHCRGAEVNADWISALSVLVYRLNVMLSNQADFTTRMRKCVSEGSLGPAKSLAYAFGLGSTRGVR